MSEFLDVMGQLRDMLVQLWLMVPESARGWIAGIAGVLLFVGVVSVAKSPWTFRYRNKVADVFADQMKVENVSVRDADGKVRSRRPSPAEIQRQCRSCCHVWPAPHGFIVILASRISDSLENSDVKTRLDKAFPTINHQSHSFLGGHLVRARRKDV